MAAGYDRPAVTSRLGAAAVAGAAIGAIDWALSDATSGTDSFFWTAAAYTLLSALVMLADQAVTRALPRIPGTGLWLSFWTALYAAMYVNVWLLPRQSFRTLPSISLTITLVAGACLLSLALARLGRPLGVPLTRALRIPGLALLAVAAAVAVILPLATGRPDLGSHHQPRQPGQMSAVLVVIDTMRADHLSSYGYARPTSPRLDDLARRGVRFDRVYSTSSWTVPAVASLFSGQLLSTHGTGAIDRRFSVPETLAEGLSAQGIVTAGFSSNPLVSSLYGFDRGFDTFVSYRDGLVNPVVDFAEGTTLGQFLQRPMDGDRLVIDTAIQWLEAHPDDRFFLYVHLFAPHKPYEPPRTTRRRLVDSSYTGIEYHGAARGETLSAAALKNLIERYDAEIAYADALVGELEDTLTRLGIDRSTAVAVTSDHGEAFGEHGQWEHGQTLYVEETRIPLIVSDPRLPAGGTVDTTVSLADLHPTMRDLLGLDTPGGGAGVNLSEMMRRAAAGSPAAADARPVVSEILGEAGTVHPDTIDAVVLGEHRLIRNVTRGSIELYRLSDDPGESAPARDPLLTEALRPLLVHAWWQSGTAVAERTMRLSDEDMKRLRSLGYLR